MKSQKLKLEEIKVGDKIIAISKSGGVKSIAIVSKIEKNVVWAKISPDVNANMHGSDFDFYHCPQGFDIVPNLYHHESNIPLIRIGKYLNSIDLFICKDGKERINYLKFSPENITPIPDEPEVVEMTIEEIQEKLGKKIKIVEKK